MNYMYPACLIRVRDDVQQPDNFRLNIAFVSTNINIVSLQTVV